MARPNTPKFYLYGELNTQVLPKIYGEGETDTAETVIDNTNSIIYVNVFRVPHALNIKDINSERFYDGSESVLIDLTEYASQESSVAYAQIEGDYLVFYNSLRGEVSRVEFPKAQIQADWNETNPESPSYIKNKPNIPTEEELNKIVLRNVEETVGKVSIPARLSSLPNTDISTPAKREESLLYVDQGRTTNTKISIESVKQLNTKLASVDSDAQINDIVSGLSVDDFIFVKDN